MPTSCLLNSRWRQTVFSVGPREYVWLDVFLAAMLRGEWHQFERQLGEGLACLAAAADPQAAWPDDRQIEEAANTFRYERDLITSDETISWLDRAGLTMDAWTDYLVRRLLRDRLRDRFDGLPQRHPAPMTVEDADFAAEGLCSGTFDRFVRVLAGRAAASVRHEDAVVDDGTPRVEQGAVDRLRTEHAVWLDALPPGEVSDRVMRLARLESAFCARARAAATGHALASQLARHRLEWTRVDLERVSFDTADRAQEAVCCVRDDGLTLTEVAIESRCAVRDTRDLLERIDPELRDGVLCASVDELVGPVAVGSRHEVVCVVDRRPADLADPLVRARAEAAVIDQMTARAVLADVRWAERPRS